MLHQVLRWHHLVSHVDRYPTTTVAGLEADTLADGLFHAVTYLFTLAGLWLLWTVSTGSSPTPGGRRLVGFPLFGLGVFNVVEWTVNHQILGLHYVREGASHRLAWDLGFLAIGTSMVLGFLAIGATMVVGGWLLQREAARVSPADRRTGAG